MGYHGNLRPTEEGNAVYRTYLDKMAAFVSWLLGHGHSVRLLIGDVVYDGRTPDDLIRRLRDHRATSDMVGIVHEPIRCVNDLLAQLATTDLVVAARFHNVLLALMMGRPVISLSYYHRKNEALMAEMNGLMKELQESGELVGTEGLADPSNTKTVRVQAGLPVVTDGPLAEAREHFGGYLVVDCESLERAVEIAARWPNARFSAMEVRPIMDPGGGDM